MSEKLASMLEKDEELRLVSKSEKFELLDKTNKKSIVTRMAITVVITLAVILLYISTAGKTSGVKWGLVVFLAAVGVLVLMNDPTSARKIRKKEYALTTKRLIILEETDKIIPFSEIKEYSFKKDSDGHVSLLIGARASKAPEKKWRALAAGPVCKSEDEKTIEKFGVYAIDNSKTFEKLFRELCPLK